MAPRLDKKQLNTKLFQIALPISVQGVVSDTLGMVDDLMVGMLGPTELAGVGVATQLTMIHYMLLFGLISGTATYMAQFYGSGDMKNIRKCIGFGQTLLAAVGVLFFLIAVFRPQEVLAFYTDDPAVQAEAESYLRVVSVQFLFLAFSAPMEMAFKATQQTRIPMVISTVVFSTNTILNYIFIFGKFGAPALGVAGAALGTAVARGLQMLLDLLFYLRKGNCFRGSYLSFFGWSGELIQRVMKNAWPTTCNEMLWGLGQTMYVAAFNRIGTLDYAAYQAANSITNIFAFAAFSVGDASLIMVGQKLGEGDREGAIVVAKHLLKVGTIFGSGVGLLLMALAKPLSLLFNLTPAGQHLTFLILLIFGLFMGVNLMNGILITGILRGGGDTRFAMIAECSCVWFVAVPLAFAAALLWHLPIYLAVLLTKAEEITKWFILMKRFRSEKWANTVITGL